MSQPPPHATVTVFCGSKFGGDPAYRQATEALGTGLARAGIRVVYGGGRIGLDRRASCRERVFNWV